MNAPLDNGFPRENAFGKMRGRYDETLARRAVKSLAQTTLDALWALDDASLAELVAAHYERDKGRQHPLEISLRIAP